MRSVSSGIEGTTADTAKIHSKVVSATIVNVIMITCERKEQLLVVLARGP